MERRAASCLAVSLLLHGMAAWLLPGHRLPLSSAGQALELRLSLRPPIAPPLAAATSATPARRGRTQVAPAKPASVQTTALDSAPPAAVMPPFSARAAIEQARSEIAAASRHRAIDRMSAPLAAVSPASGKAVPEVRIETLGDGLFRITAAGGRHYCLQRLPEVATRDIPGGAVSIPLNCR